MVKDLEKGCYLEKWGNESSLESRGEVAAWGSDGTGEAGELCRGLMKQCLECQAENPKNRRKPTGP